jgi:hypothetical protein
MILRMKIGTHPPRQYRVLRKRKLPMVRDHIDVRPILYPIQAERTIRPIRVVVDRIDGDLYFAEKM